MTLVLVLVVLAGGAFLFFRFGPFRNRGKKSSAVRYVCDHCGQKDCECQMGPGPSA